jgi:hypothetical protein
MHSCVTQRSPCLLLGLVTWNVLRVGEISAHLESTWKATTPCQPDHMCSIYYIVSPLPWEGPGPWPDSVPDTG